jgi:hypothetical protein
VVAGRQRRPGGLTLNQAKRSDWSDKPAGTSAEADRPALMSQVPHDQETSTMPDQAERTIDKPPRRPPLSSYGDTAKSAEQIIANNGW